VTQQNSALSEELSTSSEELASQADKLVESVSYFKTTKNEFEQYNILEIENQIRKFQEMLTGLKNREKQGTLEAKPEAEKPRKVAEKIKSLKKKPETKIKPADNQSPDKDFERF
jgi:methyl-accepting chemotaxis protein